MPEPLPDFPHRTLCACCAGPRLGRPPLGRRAVLGGLFATGLATAARAQTTLAPQAALDGLMQGNARYAAGKPSSLDADLAAIRGHTVGKQEPFAAVLSCADSRVPPEIIFDQTIGDLFVTRVAGNVATPEIIASLEYGAEVLGTAAILVLGHAGCGAVKAAMANKPVPGQISALFPPLRQAIAEAAGNLDAAIADNARIQATILRAASPLLAARVAAGKLTVAAGVYDLATGRVTLLT